MNPIIVTITGPSSAGKTVLQRALSENGFEPLVSTTTRPMRAAEIEGRDYHFVSKAKFLEMLNGGGLIENVEYDGNFYGVSACEAVRAFEQGKPAVLVAEPHGCEQIHDLCQARGWTVLRVFVNNPIEVLIDRMLHRFHDDVKALDDTTAEGQRMVQAKIDSHGARIQKILGQEQEEWVKPAYSGQVKYDLIIDRFGANKNEVVDQVQDLVQQHMLTMGSPRRPKP